MSYTSTRYLCPVKKCEWFHDEPRIPPGFDYRTMDTRKAIWLQAARTESVMVEHLLTHPRWRIPRKFRKLLAQHKVTP